MENILFSSNGHLRTLINKNIEDKCKMYKSLDSFINSYENMGLINLIILDESPLFDKNEILETLFIMDISCPIICLFISNKRELHKVSDKLIYIPKPINDCVLNTALQSLNLSNEKLDNINSNLFDSRLIGNGDKMNKVREDLNIIAKKNYPTLIFGETGVGKELAANILHNGSRMHRNDMICVNCSELNSPIADSILFGHDKGSYTGASYMEEGLIQSANNTTFFLDEIENLNKVSQAKMLRLVESGEYRRVGSRKILKSNFRLITASNCNLQNLIAKDEFRLDFFYRISQFSITIPPLREHKEDIKDLIGYYFLKRGETRKLDDDLESYLMNYDFPGNVRELNAILERSRAFSTGSTIYLHS
jgi:transcriptional regulator with PAS, ATPase and Fis domain